MTAEHLQQPLLFSRWSCEHKAQIITATLRNCSALLGDRVGNTQAAENKHTAKLWRGRGIERESGHREARGEQTGAENQAEKQIPHRFPVHQCSAITICATEP